MAQDNGTTTLEIGTNDKELGTTKKKNAYVIGAVAMAVIIAIVVTLSVVLTRNGDAEQVTTTTEGPTTPVTPSTTTTVVTPTTTDPTTTTVTPTLPPSVPDQIELEDIINGVFSASSFNGTWTSGKDILYRSANGDLVLYDVDAETPTVLVDNSSQILQQSSRFTQLSPDGTHVALAYNVAPVYRYSFLGRYAAINIVSGVVTEIVPPNVARSSEAFLQNFVWGPSGTSCAFVYLNNIFYQSSLTDAPQQITISGQLNVVYNGIPDWVYEEEVFASHNALWFSNDGLMLAYATFDDSNVRVMKVPHYGVPGSVDYQYTQHHEIRYPKSGTTNPTVSVTLRNLTSGVQTIYSAPGNLNEPILKSVTFVDDERIAIMWTNRVQTSLSVLLCTAAQNPCLQIFTYTEANGWIDNNPLIFNSQGNAFITILPQAVSGVLYKQIVQVTDVNANLWTAAGRLNTPHTVAEILQWTPNNVIWYKATHVNDTAEQHIYTVDMTGLVTCFTCDLVRPDGGSCLYNDAAVSVGGTRVAINCAGPDIPQIYIYDLNGTQVYSWEENQEISTLVASRSLPSTIRLSVPLSAGLPEADVQIQVPSDYQNRTNVPMLVYVYGGPDTALVTKQWGIDWGTSLVNRWGIAVAQIDGRGSGLRGVANMFALNRMLGTVEIEDQINVTRYLQQQLPWVDGNRTCIWGWSYGGYASSLALARGDDVFRCAVAVAPVVDWRFYDTIYTERYMDTPQNNAEGYAASTLLTAEVAESFRSKRYMLVHGTADDNVHYQHAMLLSRLLQRRDVYFTQMSYTDEDHGLVGVRPHLYHAIEQFLQENML